jgi:hypothetical protein
MVDRIELHIPLWCEGCGTNEEDLIVAVTAVPSVRFSEPDDQREAALTPNVVRDLATSLEHWHDPRFANYRATAASVLLREGVTFIWPEPIDPLRLWLTTAPIAVSHVRGSRDKKLGKPGCVNLTFHRHLPSNAQDRGFSIEWFIGFLRLAATWSQRLASPIPGCAVIVATEIALCDYEIVG